MFKKLREKIDNKLFIWTCTESSSDLLKKERDYSGGQRDRGISIGEAYIGYKVYEHYKGKK